MLRRIRSSMTYANVVATIALVIALGGTSYAALSITGRDVVDSSLTGRDIKNSSLTSSDVRNSSLRSSDIRNGTLLSADFKAGQLPTGPQGLQGPPGKAGLPGLLRSVDGSSGLIAVPPGEVVLARAVCPAVSRPVSPVATGGGWVSQGPATLQVLENVPYTSHFFGGDPPLYPPRVEHHPGAGNAWGVRVRNTGAVETHFWAYVVCSYVDTSGA